MSLHRLKWLKTVLRRRRVLKKLKVFEERYGMVSSDFYSKLKQGLIPEPEDPVIHGDFII